MEERGGTYDINTVSNGRGETDAGCHGQHSVTRCRSEVTMSAHKYQKRAGMLPRLPVHLMHPDAHVESCCQCNDAIVIHCFKLISKRSRRDMCAITMTECTRRSEKKEPQKAHSVDRSPKVSSIVKKERIEKD